MERLVEEADLLPDLPPEKRRGLRDEAGIRETLDRVGPHEVRRDRVPGLVEIARAAPHEDEVRIGREGLAHRRERTREEDVVAVEVPEHFARRSEERRVD